MSILIKEDTNKYVMNFDSSGKQIQVTEWNIGSWNVDTAQYDWTLANTYTYVPSTGPGSVSYANMFDYVGGLVTTISTANTYYPVNCVTTSNYANGFTHTNNRLTKVGDATGPIKLEGIIAFNGSNNDELHVYFFKNGSIVPCSKGTMVISGNGKGNTISFHCVQDMLDGDYIEVYVANVVAARDITLENLNVIITEIA